MGFKKTLKNLANAGVFGAVGKTVAGGKKGMVNNSLGQVGQMIASGSKKNKPVPNGRPAGRTTNKPVTMPKRENSGTRGPGSESGSTMGFKTRTTSVDSDIARRRLQGGR